jgi:hypothetical protein
MPYPLHVAESKFELPGYCQEPGTLGRQLKRDDPTESALLPLKQMQDGL